MRVLLLLGLCVATAMAGDGYGAEPAPPAPPEPEPYADPMADAADAMVQLEEGIIDDVLAIEEGTTAAAPAGTTAAPVAEEAPVAAEAPVEAPLEATDAPVEAPVAEPTDAPAATTMMPEEIIIMDEMPMAGYSDVAAEEAPDAEPTAGPEPMPEPEVDPMDGGYRRSALKGARKRVISWAAVKESDMFLVFDKDCRDNHGMCRSWASVVRGSRHPVTGKLVRKSECIRNKFMLSRDGCPLSCGVCTPSRRDWAVRRRLAMRKRALRLRNKNKNL